MAAEEGSGAVDLNIRPETVCFIIIKAREFDAKVEPVEEDPGSNEADSGEREILEDYADDPTLAELRGVIEALNEDEMLDLTALAWLGRGDFESWDEARAMAQERYRGQGADYLIGIPALGDYVEEGFSALGYSCEDFEIGRL